MSESESEPNNLGSDQTALSVPTDNPFEQTIYQQQQQSAPTDPLYQRTTEPPNPYTYSQRDLEDQKEKALQYWNIRVKICFGLQLLAACSLLHSYYWFTTVISFVIVIGCYIYSYVFRQRKNEFALAYLILVTLNFIKNVFIIYWLITGNPDAWEIFLICVLIADCAFFAPATLYCTWYLYQSQSIDELNFA
eukprot:TRINITY_DN1776_c0_g1_i1.p1 TRINITY_DN1776_c0_g1~~TRINITY_DN1776_c0_g1_i1.p1  ORF type:complete len:192 (+),score=7.54 TRINITY_DN1776_c0_g1_i1:45-620(+)